MTVYLIHFEKKYKHAQHYIGFVEKEENLFDRMRRHRKGEGSRILDAVTKAGIEFHVVRAWLDGDRNFERKLKNQKDANMLCPDCNPKSWHKRAMS